ncbi:uncharacterized protein LOC128962377 [Oppia nitens]|uniref:uncharacterized protein LOC128962377 n=1 Tax=Oppia nitens TaxID=1686743 RepID=UPI0023DB7DB6|nr:uncharacterized protein LOC128962377 [Oppia nitens]
MSFEQTLQPICDNVRHNNESKTDDSNMQLSFKGCCYNTFSKILKRMGYKYSYIIREEIINTPRIQEKIKQFFLNKNEIIKTIVTNDGTPVFVWLDECCCDKNIVPKKTLVTIDPNKREKTNKSCGKGPRFSVIHAGNEDGFINGALDIVYKSEINAEIFENWLKTKLMPNLEKNSVVIFDNCSVHSRQYNRMPNTYVIIQWLYDNNVHYDSNMNRKQLLEIVKNNSKPPQYYCDDIIRSFGCYPLRLPPYCCDLNPIEMLWNDWKQIHTQLVYKQYLKSNIVFMYNFFVIITGHQSSPPIDYRRIKHVPHLRQQQQLLHV